MRHVPHTCPEADDFLRVAKTDASRALYTYLENRDDASMAEDIVNDQLDALHFMYRRLREQMREALDEAEAELKELESQVKERDKEAERLDQVLRDERYDSNNLAKRVKELEDEVNQMAEAVG